MLKNRAKSRYGNIYDGEMRRRYCLLLLLCGPQSAILILLAVCNRTENAPIRCTVYGMCYDLEQWFSVCGSSTGTSGSQSVGYRPLIVQWSLVIYFCEK